jgi:hypothetical protein
MTYTDLGNHPHCHVKEDNYSELSSGIYCLVKLFHKKTSKNTVCQPILLTVLHSTTIIEHTNFPKIIQVIHLMMNKYNGN